MTRPIAMIFVLAGIFHELCWRFDAPFDDATDSKYYFTGR